MPTSAKIVCGKCKVDPEIITDASGEAESIACPSCGQRDKLEDARRIAGDHFADAAARVMQSNLAKSTRGNKFMKFEAKPLRKRTSLRLRASDLKGSK
jgi:DNA-directed RNA polymerase subunit RPC12/RpoP